MTLPKSSDAPASDPWPETMDLPPYLQRTEPMEIEDLPLQVSLLTMEIASLWRTLSHLLKLSQETSDG